MWRQLQASLASTERASHRLLQRALERDGADFTIQRVRAHTAICAAAHPRIRDSDPPFESVHAALAVIKYVHGDDLEKSSWREFSNGAGSATTAAALLHNFSAGCTDYYDGPSGGDALPPDWYAKERFQGFEDLHGALLADNRADDHLECMAVPEQLRCLPYDHAFDAKVDRSDGGETSVVFVDASSSSGGSAAELWRVPGDDADRERDVVQRASNAVPVGSYVVTYGRLVTQDTLQVLSSFAASGPPGDELLAPAPALQVHVQQKLDDSGAAAAAGNASSWDTTPELEEFRRSGGLQEALDVVLRGSATTGDAESLGVLLTVGTCASSEMATRQIIQAGALPALTALIADGTADEKAGVAAYMALGNMALHPVAVTAFLENDAMHALLDCATHHPSRVYPHLVGGSDTGKLEARLEDMATGGESGAEALLARVIASREQ